MKASSKKWFVIINPTSGNGSAKKKWGKIERLLKQHEFNFDFAFTEYEKHSSKLVQEAIKKDITNIISIGGDGTLHNIVNGIMSQNILPSNFVNVGVIPIGTGNDWIKTHKIPKNIKAALNIIKSGNIMHQDLGEIDFKNSNKPSVFFNNAAGVGFDGYVVSKVEKFKNIGALSYLYGALTGIFFFKNFGCKININSEEILENILMLSVGLCKYSGGGMQLTNTPNPFDGLLDVSIAKNFNSWDVIKNLVNLFNGKIYTIKKVQTLKTTSLNIEVNQANAPLIQADGELIGSGDIEIRVLPKSFFVLWFKSLI